MIELKGLSAGYGGQAVLSGVSMELTPGKVLALLGPNGCGKSTLLKTILGLQPRLAGEILVDGTPSDEITPRQLAQKVTYLAQSRNTPNITARRMVLHGRFPYLSYPRRYREEDYEMVEKALRWADAEGFANRSMEELSGGQRQKVYLAMALAQDTQTILMDEPTTFLDVAHQLEVMAIARRLAGEGKAVLMVLHDLCLALRWADEVAVLAGGGVLFRGTAEEAFEGKALDRAFGVRLDRVMTQTGWQYYYS
ncbi:MAG: ABC transporter ATP-binding protein [Clostridiales bacterium]|nr:ABC transporter ATP-binding protein [Clostridiales bacterium]